MNKEKIKGLISMYDMLFDDYSRQMLWVCNKEFSQRKKRAISADITVRMFFKLLYAHTYLMEEAEETKTPKEV